MSRSGRADRGVPVAARVSLFLFFLALGMMAWSGTLHSSDGMSLYGVSDTLARDGRWDIESLGWLNIQQGTIGRDGLLYARKGPGSSVVALPLTWLGLRLPGISPLHASLLLNPLVHALTALYLFLLLGRVFPMLGRRWALALTLIWAAGSPALPYVKSFFSEPLVALALTGALYHLLRQRESARRGHALAAGLWLALSLLARSPNAIVIPFYALALLVREPPRQVDWSRLRDRVSPFLLFALPVAAGGLLYLLYNQVRFGSPLESGYIAGEEFSAIWWQGILGQSIAPGRGLLWFAPWLPLSVVGLWVGRRRQPWIMALAASSALAYLLLYGKWYLWSGGFAWGPRFLIPVLPLLLLPLGALVRAPAPSRPVRVARGLLLPLGAAGGMVNLIGTLWDFDLQQQALDRSGLPLFAPETLFHPRYAQIPGLLREGLRHPASIDLAWMHEGQVDRLALLWLLLIAAAGLAAGWSFLQSTTTPRRSAAAALLLTVGLLGLLGQLHSRQNPALQSRLAPLPMPPGTQVWYDSPELAEDLFHLLPGTPQIAGYLVGGPTLGAEDRRRAERWAGRAAGPLYVMAAGPPSLQHGLDRMLLDRLFLVGEHDGIAPRLTEYWQGPLSAPIPYARDLVLPGGAAIRLHAARVTPEVAAGQILALERIWEAGGPLPADLQGFLHLYDEAGTRVLQQDRPPGGGLRSPDTWRPGVPVPDRQALRLPPDLPSGRYTLQFGLYRRADGARAVDGSGNGIIEIPIEVRGGQGDQGS